LWSLDDAAGSSGRDRKNGPLRSQHRSRVQKDGRALLQALRMLTRKQRETLLFIAEYSGREGVAPNYDEIARALCLKSKSGINRLLNGLADRGFIRITPYRARGIEL